MPNPITWLLGRKKRNKKKQTNSNKEAQKDSHNQEIINVLKDVPLLSSLSATQRKNVASKFHERNYGAGEIIMAQGDKGDEFFIIRQGTAEIFITEDDQEKIITGIKANDYFGEQALLTSSERNASVRASEDLKVLVLNRQQFEDLTEKGNVMFAARRAVCCQDDMLTLQRPKINESLDEKEINFITNAIKTNLLFMNHDKEVIDRVVPHFKMEKYTNGQTIIKEGDQDATEFYVIASGEVEVSTEKNGSICKLKAGSCFGELALMYNASRNATITICSEECEVYAMERQAFRYEVINQQKDEDSKNFEFLRSVKLLQPLLNNEITLLDMASTLTDHLAGEVIFSQGDEPDRFYIIKQGACNGTIQKEEEESFVLNRGNFFGELALKNLEARKATITSGEEGCQLLSIGRDDFKQLLGPLDHILDRNAKEYEKPANERVLIGDTTKICDLDEFKTIGLLGRGAFGKVTLVVDPHTQKSYALKAIKKTQIEELGQASHIVNEKKVMMMMDSRFLVNLRKTYKSAWRVYFLVDVCLGGELFTILRKKRSFNEKTTQFYAGCVVEAFSYMHGMNIIYRDLKPENLVMDTQGYIKVTDFGFAKVVPKKTYTLCGTPDYLAPEIVTGQGHGKGVDWWCLGVLIYELLSSFPPFFDDEPMGTYRKIIQGKFKFPKYFSSEARDIIARLLRTKPTKRLAVMRGGADNIRNHMWYKGFKWEKLRDGKLEAPFKPEVKSMDDISNFNQKDRRASAPFSGKCPTTPWDVEF